MPLKDITIQYSSFNIPRSTLAEDTITQLEKIIASLRAVPVEVYINLFADQNDGVEDPEKVSRKKTAKKKIAKRKPPISIKPGIRQDPKK